MTRHAKNCTAGAVYTYHEKQKDTKSCGYGTHQSRLGKDSVKDFDCCCLSLQPCRNPVITPDGFLYDKESILEYILHQKLEIARKTKEYEKHLKKEQDELAEIAKAEESAKTKAFIQQETSIVKKENNIFTGPSTSKNNAPEVIEPKKQLPSFWIPSLTPDSKQNTLKKPDTVIYCPMSRKPLKAKDLIPVSFTLVNDPDEKKSLITNQCRYKCAVTHDVLGNSLPCAVLKTSGKIVTMECVERIIKIDMIDPTCGKKLKESDIIPLQRGGTGYASTNEGLQSKIKRPVMMA